MSMYEIILAKFALIMKKLAQVNASEQKVYNAGYEKGKAEGGYEQGVADGKQAEYDAFWDAYQPTGSEASPQAVAFAGVGWNDRNFKPKYDICFSGYCAYAFSGTRITDVKGILESLGRRLDTSKVVNAMHMFYDSKTVTRLPVLDLSSATNIDYAVYNCVALTHIDKVILKSDGSQKVTTFLSLCALLENVIFEGVIGQGGLNLKGSTKLSKASIESVIFALDLTEGRPATTVTLSLAAVNKAFETSEGANDGANSAEFNDRCASARVANWTISLV